MLEDLELKNKYMGCLVGGAVGDALGYSVEFLKYNQIVEKYGKKGITKYEIKNGERAKISDDTQMAYFTGNAFKNLRLKELNEEIKEELLDSVYEQYIIWARGQLEGYDVSSKLNPVLFKSRAPGNTCMTALLGKEKGSRSNKINNSKGSGGVMRVAPIALISKDNSDNKFLIDLAADVAAITHSHELGYIPAAILVAIIRAILDNKDLDYAVEYSKNVTRNLYLTNEHKETQENLINKAIELSTKNISDEAAISVLGEGWVAEEAIAIAIYCSLKHKDNFEDAIIAAVNHNGDSDTTGAITGNIMGSLLGYDAIPNKFRNNLELEKGLIELSEDLFKVADGIKTKSNINTNYSKESYQLINEKLYGTSAQDIYDDMCINIGWDKSLRNKFGMLQKCYAQKVDGRNSAWFVVHSNLSGSDHECYTNRFITKNGIDKLFIEEEYIPRKNTVSYRISLGDIRIVFYKNKKQEYRFAGVYKQKEHFINKLGHHVLVYEKIADHYPIK